MPQKPIIVVGGILLGGVVGLVGCDTPRETTESPPAATSTTAPAIAVDGAIKIRDQDVACETGTHYGQIRWQNGQPSLTFGRKPAETTLTDAMPVGIIGNPDGSVTYGFQGDAQFYMRVYPDFTCFLQVVDETSTVILEEDGQVILGLRSPSPPVGLAAPEGQVAVALSGGPAGRLPFSL